MTDTNAENLIAAMDQLGLTPEQVAARMDVAVDVIEGMRAGVLWGQRIPEPPVIAAAEIIKEAENNGRVYAGAAETANPIELPQDDAGEAAPSDESALRVIEAAEAREADALKTLRNELLAKCETVEHADQPAADAIMKRAIRGGIDERNGAQQIQATLRPRLKLTMAQMKAHWTRCKAEVERDDYVPPTAEELAERARKPQLEIQEGHPDRTVSNLRDIHAASGRIFERGAPVRTVYDKESDGSVAHQLTVPGLILETHFVCQPWRFDQKVGEKDVDLPASHAQMYLAWKGEQLLPPLNGFTTAPILSSNGSIRTARGYDVATGLFCERVPDVAPLVPVNPTRAEAEAALLLVRNVVKTFPFKDAITRTVGGIKTVDLRQPPGMDESSFLTSLLGSVCRPSLWLAPGSLFAGAKASGSGVGKGLLVRIVCAIAYGRRPIAIGPGGNNEELEKRISAAFLQGGPMIFLDNFNDLTLRSSALESALTERPSQVRQFGTLDMVTINALASVFVTGNAIDVGEDSVRRFVRTEFDAQVEDAEGRRFSGNILAEVMDDRPAILAALLTIWRYGRLAPDIKRGLPFGSYEPWSEWVRDPLLTLGCRDPVERLSETKARDPERQKIGELFTRWWEIYKSTPKKASEVTDYEIGKIINPQNKERQFVVVALGKFIGSRVAGFVMTRQASTGRWSAATFALQKTENGESDVGDAGCTTANPILPMDGMVPRGSPSQEIFSSAQKESATDEQGDSDEKNSPTAATPKNHTIHMEHRAVQPSDDQHGPSVSKSANTHKVPPSRNSWQTQSQDGSGEQPNDANISGAEPTPEPPATEPLGGTLGDSPTDPIPESILKIEREARAAMAEVAARAAAAEAAKAAEEQPTSQKKRKPE